ncbi:hypothetical protein [Shewanella spartinae]|uniref:hypothetical protein n=1 Tax=Shewanella spartinae TaxID=2864205 RepID=UPI001C658CA4|nr:hypothetical protein [Shewanella spartinae]QYJ92339.1 hypothetical protein K0I31_11865 [Shewanella spartinae]
MQYSDYTATNLARAIDSLDRRTIYDYPTKTTKSRLRILQVTLPEGPILIERITTPKGKKEQKKEEISISVDMIQRLANAIKPNRPVNVDRVFGGSYNTRSALETLLLHTEYFYLCYPGRIQYVGQSTKIKNGHKHLIYCPDNPHSAGIIETQEVHSMCIIEADRDIQIDALTSNKPQLKGAEAELQREHEQMQVLLVKCAEALGLKAWIAKNDHGVQYNGKRLIEQENVIKDLRKVAALQGYMGAPKAGELIDCIWFDKEGRNIPAIIEIEHSTGVTSGLTRMKGFMEAAPRLMDMTYVIAAPDDKYRTKINQKANEPQFRELNIKYLPYSAILDLYHLTRRSMCGIDNIKFLHTFLEDPLAG